MRKTSLLAAATLMLLALATPVTAFAATGSGSSTGSDSSNTSDDDLTGGVQIFDGADDSPSHDKIHKDNIKKHHDLEGRYGDNYGSLPMPPLAIKPAKGPKQHLDDSDETPGQDLNGQGSNGQLPVPGASQSPTPAPSAGTSSFSGTNNSSQTSTTTYVTAPVLPTASTSNGKTSAKLPAQINPASNSPILLKDVRVSGQSPAADFMNESMIWAGVLGAAAIALGGLVGFNAIRARKEPKDDFFFEA
jgi:hypothetical protein